MTTVLCTLYNSLYLDKGLVLYDSLCECAKDFKLYVLCMDDKCYEVLTDLKQEHHIPVRLSALEAGDNELLKAKCNRSMGEYCWTCSSSFIRYVLNHFQEPICTYIDADMYFYHDPQILVDEMREASKSVMVVPHRFPKDKEYLAKKVGKYCVEFNTFENNKEGLEVLEYWRNKCLECCSNLGDGKHWGDQKYLEEFEQQFNCIYVSENPGAGLAPWNIMHYKATNGKECSEVLFKPLNRLVPTVFYHYQGIQYQSRKNIITAVVANQKDIDYGLVDFFYFSYLKKIEEKKCQLEDKYHILFIIRNHPSDIPISKLRAIFHRTWVYKVLLFLFQLTRNKVELYCVDI